MIPLLLAGCVSAWDATRREDSAELTLTLDAPEAQASFDVAATVYLQAGDAGDTDTATIDTGWDETTGVSLDLNVLVHDTSGEGRVRFLAWGAQSTDVVPEPVDFDVADRPTLYRSRLFCAAREGTCRFGQRATLDLREGGPVTLVLRLTLDASADEESAKYISDQTQYELSFR